MFLRTICTGIKLLTVVAVATAMTSTEGVHYPTVIAGEIPLYPSLARTAHITGTVRILLAVKDGSIINADVKSAEVQVTDPSHRAVYDDKARAIASRQLSEPSVANVKTWRFEPGSNASLTVTYIYRIEGDVTSSPENPIVELELPRFVRVTAKPFKPTRD